MAVIDSTEMLLQAKNYSGSGGWLDKSPNGHDGVITGATFKAYSGRQYIWFPGTTDNHVLVTIAATTVYDYTVTYLDGSTATGTVTSDGGGVLLIGADQANFVDKDVKLIDVTADGGGTTLAVFDASFATEPFASFTDSLSKVWTINRSATDYVSTIVDQPMFLFDGVNDYIVVADHADLDFAAAEPLAAIGVARIHSASQTAIIFGKKTINTAGDGWTVGIFTDDIWVNIGDGVAGASNTMPEPAINTMFSAGIVRNIALDHVKVFHDGVASGLPQADITTQSLHNDNDALIGAAPPGTMQFFRGQIMAVALWRSALIDTQLATAANELLFVSGTPSTTRQPLVLGIL